MPCQPTWCAARPPDGQRQAPQAGWRRSARRTLRGLRTWLALAVITGSCAQAAAWAAPGTAPAPADLAAQLLRLVNLHRAHQHLPAWEADPGLAAIASENSQRMAQRRQLGHDGFDARFAQARRRHCVENLAAGFDSAEPLLAAWLASPSHRDNLLARWPRQVGLGQVASYVTLMACEPAAP